MPHCNDTLETQHIVEDPLFGNVTFHRLGLFISAVFGGISIVISFYLIMQHALHYLKPSEQKHILRILVMVPIYSLVSFLSYLYYRETVYFQVIRDCYDAFAIASFFALLCSYIAPSLHDQKDYFRSITPKNWFLGVFYAQKCTGGENKGPFRKPRSGLTWFNIIWIGIFQYCFIRVFFTVLAVITQAAGVYCLASDNPAFAHVWLNTFQAVAVSIAMFMVIQFYIQLRETLSEHRPFLKVLAIKLVIFFSFWQTIVISFLSSHGPLQPTKKIAGPDISIGLPSMLLCIEMAFFAVLHLFAYPWKPYSIEHSYGDPLNEPGSGLSGGAPRYQGGKFGWKALVDATNPWDIIKASARGFRWLFIGYRKRLTDSSYQGGKLSSGAGYVGPTYAETDEPATELQAGAGAAAGRRGHVPHDSDGYWGSPEDDRAGLLRNPQRPGRAQHDVSPYRSSNDEFSHGDDSQFGTTMPSHPPRVASPRLVAGAGNDAKSDDFGPAADHDLEYHPHMGPPPGSAISTGQHGDVHPAFRNSNPDAAQAWQRQADAWGDPSSLDHRGGPPAPPPYPGDNARR